MSVPKGICLFLFTGFLLSGPSLAHAVDEVTQTGSLQTKTNEEIAQEKKKKMERLERQMNSIRSLEQVNKLNNLYTVPNIPKGVAVVPRNTVASSAASAPVSVPREG